MSKKSTLILLLVVCSIFNAGCLSVKAPSRAKYMLHVAAPAPVRHMSSKQVLEVDNAVIADQFSQLNFVYRLSDIKYTQDYYNIFFISPAQQIEQETAGYLQYKKIYNYVTTGVGSVDADYYLRPNIVALYADYRNRENPRAVIEINYVLVGASNKISILFNKTYRQSVPLQHKDSISLVHGWNRGLQKILANLSRDLCHIQALQLVRQQQENAKIKQHKTNSSSKS